MVYIHVWVVSNEIELAEPTFEPSILYTRLIRHSRTAFTIYNFFKVDDLALSAYHGIGGGGGEGMLHIHNQLRKASSFT